MFHDLMYKRAEMCRCFFIQPTAWHNTHLSEKSKEEQERKTPSMDAKAEAAAPSPSYKDFEPFCQWEKEKDKDTLIVQLPSGFKKDQLKVLVSNQGLVRFSGECPTGGNTLSRFQREIRVPKNCNMNGIQAKFLRGNLHIIMPKNIDSIAQDQAAPPVGDSQEQAKPKPQEEKGEGGEKEKVDESRSAEEGRNGVQGCVSRLKVGKKMAVSGFLVVALVVAFAAYAAYNYKYLINFTEE